MFPKVFIIPIIVILFGHLTFMTCGDSTSTSTLPGAQPTTDILTNKPYIWIPGGRRYPRTNQTLMLKTDPGYVISVEVAKCDVDSDGGDYLQINSGNTLNSTEGRVFTYNLKKSHKYLFHSNEVTGFFRVNDESKTHNDKTGIEVIFTRLNDIMTTTPEPTTTTIEVPTTSEGQQASIQVDVFGHADSDYKNPELLVCFKNALLNMTKRYCKEHNIKPRDNNVTLDNIMVDHLMKCPYTWPDSFECVQIEFKIPIFLSADSPVQGYELSTENLKLMWDSLAEDYLPNCDLSKYKEHDLNSAIKWWIVIIVSVTLIFLILLCVIKKGSVKWSQIKRRRRRGSDTVTIMSRGSVGTASLEPHYMQKTPPLFEPMYPMYNPGVETYSEPITVELRKKNHNDDDRTYAEPIMLGNNFDTQNKRLTLVQDEEDADQQDAYA